MPVGVSMTHPPMVMPSHFGHRSKNQKKSQGTTTPPCVGFGDLTGVVTGMMKAPAAPEDDVASGNTVSLLGVTVVVLPSGKVVVMGLVAPVVKVMMPFSLEITVWPAELVVTAVGAMMGVMVVDWPFGRTVLIGVVIPVGKVIAVFSLENTVSPAESVVSMIRSVGVTVVVTPSV